MSVFKNIRIPMDGALIQVYAVDKGMKLAGVKTKRRFQHYVHCIKLNFFLKNKDENSDISFD